MKILAAAVALAALGALVGRSTAAGTAGHRGSTKTGFDVDYYSS